MKTRKIGLLTVAGLFVLALLLAASGFGRADAKGQGLRTTDELDKKVLAGVTAARLPAENTEVLFETILGIRLSGYRAVSNINELLYELRSGRADAICCPDVTAEYLLRSEKGLVRLSAPEDTSNGVEGGGRLSFAMAMDRGQEDLCAELNAAISELKEDGTLEALSVAYVKADVPLDLYEIKNGGSRKTLYVGVTGAVPPLDRYDGEGVPCGFSVAFLEELGKRTGYRFETVPVSTKDLFTALRSGKIDLVFSYGTSRNTTPGERDYLVTDGYYTMQEYAYLALE